MWSVFEHFNCVTDFCDWTCRDKGGRNQHPDEAYADISGPGVVSAFFGIGYLVIFLCIVDYFVTFGLSTETRASGINRADQAIVRPVQRVLRYIFSSLKEQSKVDRIHNSLRASMLQLSETQAYTGVAILLAGFIVLFTGPLSEFHWETVSLLGWMCHNTNLTAMTSLRSVIKSEPAIRRWWRLSLMTALVGMLVIALFQAPFMEAMPRSLGTIYAICAYNNDRISMAFQSPERLPALASTLLSTGFVLLTFFVRVVKLSEPLLSRVTTCARYCGGLSQRMFARFDTKIAAVTSKTGATYLRYGIRPWLIGSMYFTVYYWDFLGSTLSEVLVLVYCFWWASIRMLMQLGRTDPDERRWTFGQILPLALLIYPAISLVFGQNTVGGKALVQTPENASLAHNSEEPDNALPGTENPPPEPQDSPPVTETTLSYNLGYLQTYDWLKLVLYQDLIQFALIAIWIVPDRYYTNYMLMTGGLVIDFLAAHFFSLYLAMVINILAEDVWKSRYSQESSSHRQAAGFMHFSICSGVSLGVFGLPYWYAQLLGGWDKVRNGSRLPLLYDGNTNKEFWFVWRLLQFLVLIFGIMVLYQAICLGFSIWVGQRRSSDNEEEDIEL